MDVRTRTPQPPLATSAAMDHSEEVQAEADEPPEQLGWSPTKLHFDHLKQTISHRRESLLTRQILSETEHTDEDDISPPPRTMSTQSTWSNPSATSMAELTSDDGRSVASPAISPPLPPTHRNNHAIPEKPLEGKVKIVGEDHVVPNAVNQTTSEKSVEANLGRKRCISFACRGKQETKVEPPPPEAAKVEPASPPKRKCMLKFICPSRAASESKPAAKPAAKRPVSPPPPLRRPVGKHRGSDSTVTQVSPKAIRKNTAQGTATPRSEPAEPTLAPQTGKYSAESSDEDGGDSMRFHEFASSDGEPDQWVQESTCHRKRLTVNDTLEKENVIRKTCEEVEEEVLEEEEDMEDEELDDEMAAVADMDDEDDGLEAEDDYESDEGFHSDDEDGFANSDSEDDSDSDYEWWKPGGASTAATSVEALDRLAIVNSQQTVPSSSLGSASSGGHMPRLASRTSFKKVRSRAGQTEAVPIHRSGSPDLPDSTDFVCGTLDEDRPMEQAYINKRNLKDAAKHKLTPQDIDPTFPTSDPETDEEDNDDVDEVMESETDDNLVHGNLEELHGTIKKALPMRHRGSSNAHRSPPATRIHSPGPAKRTGPRSPPPPTMRGSPPPRKLFGQSPRRSKSPAPVRHMTSPPNSPTLPSAHLSTLPHGLAGRPQLTHTASLPRGGPITLSNLATITSDAEDSDTGAATEIPKRGAVEIVKGVQWKRQRRKEKLHQKLCAKAAAAKGEKQHKVKPGKGAERMREVGLQLQQYRGKAEHILSL